jgi:hypothetical protein
MTFVACEFESVTVLWNQTIHQFIGGHMVWNLPGTFLKKVEMV